MHTPVSFKGKVILVGAGPGDPGLITVRGREVIQHADVVIFDHLVCKELVDLAPAISRHIYVGKKVGKHTMPQDAINALLVQEAQAGHAVVRLKGGDPFIFGRGAEECAYLRDHGVEFEVVPGVSAAAAVPAYAGIPITSRDFSTSFIAVTGHEHACKKKSDVDWRSIAQTRGTILVFMGVLNIRTIAGELMKHGKTTDTPVAVIRWGTYAYQKTLTGTLATIADQVEQVNLRPPALIVIGEVVRFRDQLDWFEKRPLFGRTILLPRARKQQSRLGTILMEKGARVIEIPAASHEPIPGSYRVTDIMKPINDYDWIIFPGEDSVHSFFEKMLQKGFDSRRLSHCRIGALGGETIDALLTYGIRPDFIPTRFCSTHVVDELSQQFPLDGVKILIPCMVEGPEGLSKAFQHAGAHTDQVSLSTSATKETEPISLDGQKLDLIVFTCSTTVRNWIERLGEQEAQRLAQDENTPIASIGPRTTQTLKGYNLPVHIQPAQSSIPALAQEIVHFFTNDWDKD